MFYNTETTLLFIEFQVKTAMKVKLLSQSRGTPGGANPLSVFLMIT